MGYMMSNYDRWLTTDPREQVADQNINVRCTKGHREYRTEEGEHETFDCEWEGTVTARVYRDGTLEWECWECGEAYSWDSVEAEYGDEPGGPDPDLQREMKLDREWDEAHG